MFAASPPPYRKGSIFLGRSNSGADIGLTTDRHLLTIAGARSGKGAALLIPNLLRWDSGSVLVIDPKGENAERSWQAREAMGQKVYIVDPFKVANVPARLRASFNPLDAITPNSHTVREDVRVIADGLVMRHDTKDGMWDDGALTMLAGFIAFVATQPADRRNLPDMRKLLRRSDEALRAVFELMAASKEPDGLAAAAGALALSDAKTVREFIAGGRRNAEWLDSPAIASVLQNSTFKLSELKNGRTSVYLVLPPQYLGEHGRFLRLFVRCAINEMAKGGQKGGRCLFMLDEFFSLGRIDEIVKAAGLMPSYGVHLWPFLQDLGQLVQLYQREGAETFFGNADAHIFFGNTDPSTLDHVSARLGTISIDEVAPHGAPVEPELTGEMFQIHRPQFREGQSAESIRTELARASESRAMVHWAEKTKQHFNKERARYEYAARSVGKARLAPEQVRELVGKRDGDKVARSMIVFAKGGDVLNLHLAPYFLPPNAPVPPLPAPQAVYIPEPSEKAVPFPHDEVFERLMKEGRAQTRASIRDEMAIKRMFTRPQYWIGLAIIGLGGGLLAQWLMPWSAPYGYAFTGLLALNVVGHFAHEAAVAEDEAECTSPTGNPIPLPRAAPQTFEEQMRADAEKHARAHAKRARRATKAKPQVITFEEQMRAAARSAFKQ